MQVDFSYILAPIVALFSLFYCPEVSIQPVGCRRTWWKLCLARALELDARRETLEARLPQ